MKVLLRTARHFSASFTIFAICKDDFKLLESLSLSLFGIYPVFKKYLFGFRFPKFSTLHLLMLKCKFQESNHSDKESKSTWSKFEAVLSSLRSSIEYSFISSAYFRITLFCSQSFTNAKNKMGPKQLPWRLQKPCDKDHFENLLLPQFLFYLIKTSESISESCLLFPMQTICIGQTDRYFWLGSTEIIIGFINLGAS